MPSLKQRTPASAKQLGRRLYVPVGQATAPLRMMPSFILAGAQRCGTTSLYRALLSHPAVLSAAYHKGVNYFDVNYDKGMPWYRGHFPLSATASLRTRGSGHEPVTFDASGYYMFHPLAAERIGRDLPNVKVLVLVRDPIERAYSAYRHEFARNFETETFERALELEDERVQPELERMLADHSYQSDSYRHHA
ncbi:MAG: sulfotransferase, partial [Actinomycetes bacterium]